MPRKPVEPTSKKPTKTSYKLGSTPAASPGSPGGRLTTVSMTTTEDDSTTRGKKAQKEYLQHALDVFRSIADDDNEIQIRARALEELRFKEGDQWPADIAEIRRAKRRPIVTINKVKPAVRIICNDQRQNRASIRVFPMDASAHQKTAEIMQGAVRHIEVNSMSDIAVDNACEGQVTFGFGYVRLDITYASPYSMDKEIKIGRVKDPFSVYCGPSTEPDYSDMDDCLITEDLDPITYEQRFDGISQYAGLTDFSSVGNTMKEWGTRGKIRICEHFYRTFEKKTLCRMSDGSSLLKEKIPTALIPHIGIVAERTTEIPMVHWCLFNAKEILHERDWPGQFIPIIPVLGDDVIIDGKRVLSGVVRGAMDPSRQYNYFRALMTETIGLAPKSPYIMAEGQNESHETQWDTANSEMYSVLFYKPVSVGGQLAPPPQRQQSEPPIAAMVEAAIHYETDIKATTMVNDAKLGARSNETSGVAISARKAQSDVSNYNYIDNRDRAIRHIGRQCIDLIPKVYSTKQIMRIIGEDDVAQMVSIVNDPSKPAYSEDATNPEDIKRIYNLGVGLYDVSVEAGPSYRSKRQEGAELLVKLANSWPGLLEIAGPEIFDDLDFPGAKRIAKKLRMANPDLNPEEGKQTIPPAIAKQFQLMQQAMEQLTKKNEQLDAIIQNKYVEKSAELEMKDKDIQSKDRQAALKAETDKLAIQEKFMEAQLKSATDQMAAKMDQQLSMFQSQIETFMNAALAQQAHGHALEQQDNQGQIDRTIQAEAPQPSNGATT